MKKNAEKYTIAGHLERVFENQSMPLAFNAKTPRQFVLWKKKTRGKLRELIGYHKFERCTPSPKTNEITKFPEFTRIHMEIKTEPGVLMPLYILKPVIEKDRYPVVIALHGHGSGGKYSVAGRSDIPEISESIKQYNYDYGVQFVRQGFLVFCLMQGALAKDRKNGQGTISVIHPACGSITWQFRLE